PRNLLLINGHIVGDLVDALPHRVEIERCYLGLLLIGRRGGWCGWRYCVGSALRNRFGLWRPPAKLRGRVWEPLPGCIGVRLPSQGGSYTDAKSYRETDQREQGPLDR